MLSLFHNLENFIWYTLLLSCLSFLGIISFINATQSFNVHHFEFSVPYKLLYLLLTLLVYISLQFCSFMNLLYCSLGIALAFLIFVILFWVCIWLWDDRSNSLHLDKFNNLEMHTWIFYWLSYSPFSPLYLSLDLSIFRKPCVDYYLVVCCVQLKPFFFAVVTKT